LFTPLFYALASSLKFMAYSECANASGKFYLPVRILLAVYIIAIYSTKHDGFTIM